MTYAAQTDIGQFVAVLAGLGIAGFLAWRVGAFLLKWAKGVAGHEPPDLKTRLDQAFNGAPQVGWKIRGGGIYTEDLVQAAIARGYRFVAETGGVAVFERTR
jgi:hypothetical protein